MSDSLVNMVVKGSDTVVKKLKQAEQRKDKAVKTAIKIESYRLRKVINSGIRQARPGGRLLDSRTAIARLRNGRFENKKPFRGMSGSTRYDFNPEKLESHIGWTQRTPRRVRFIATRYQGGFTSRVTPAMRRLFALWGAGLSKRSKLRRYFFLNKKTTIMRTSERQIIGPTFQKEKRNISRNIAKAFQLKMAGKRV